MVKMVQFKSYKPYNFTMSINNTKMKIHVRYNSYMDNYYINIDKLNNGIYENVINSVMLTTGVDLLLQHPQLDLGQLFVVPMKTELYDQDPSSSTIQNYILMSISND